MYKEYTVDKASQQYENAEGTFKTKGAFVRLASSLVLHSCGQAGLVVLKGVWCIG